MRRLLPLSVLLVWSSVLLLSQGCAEAQETGSPGVDAAESPSASTAPETQLTNDEASPEQPDLEPSGADMEGESNVTVDNAIDDMPAAQDEPVASPELADVRIDLVFFHIPSACGCLGEIGYVIKAALDTHFPEHMEDKRLRYYMLASDDPANQSYVRMYGSQAFDLFVVTYEDGAGQAYPVRGIWAYLDDYDALGLHVKRVVEQHLGASSQ